MMLRTDFCRPDHTRFGGIIYPSDFETEWHGKKNRDFSMIASRIAGDKRFDEQCRQNIQNRIGRNEYASLQK